MIRSSIDSMLDGVYIMPETMLDLHLAIAQAINSGNDERVAELRDLLDRVRSFYLDR
jgi:hypothetical protein